MPRERFDFSSSNIDGWDFLKGIRLKENPFAEIHFVLLLLLIFILVLVTILLKKRPQILRGKKDKEVYNFLLDFKGLNENEKLILERVVKKYKIKRKYNLLILETIYLKYMNTEIINIEQSPIPLNEKEEKINKYVKIKIKLFGTGEI